jgi:hypothetical protein
MTGPLCGYRILDTTSMISGPLGTMMLADQGADVLKIENPAGGDHTRAIANRRRDLSAGFLNNNRNKKMERLIDKYASGDKNRFTIKAAYIIRDTIKAIGTGDIPPATFGIFYDDLEDPMTGGTGHTMNVCSQNNIPIIDQTVWFKWLEE